MQHFQRAESSAFFGREIGLMYTHAHLRFAEAMARFGDAETFFHALRQANPIGLRGVVASARRRQANCYYSSSDADFADRYEAAERYAEVRSGEVEFEGGWRVYSSGAGIMARLIRECLLGLRLEADALVVDPVLPHGLDGLRARLRIDDRRLEIAYRVAERGCGVRSLQLDGANLHFEREDNPYRPGGARVPRDALRTHAAGSATLAVEID
jgi:cellobiose phosphorylase